MKTPDSSLFLGQDISKQTFVVHFHGLYIPLQGTTYIIEAAKRLEEHNLRFHLVGDGQTFAQTYELAQRLGVKNVKFVRRFGDQVIASYTAQADLCLGIFGDTDKAKRGIPNKVYQYLAVKKPVVTGDSPAIREVFVDGEHLLLCELANPDSLAERILQCYTDRKLREKIAEGGYWAYQTRCSPLVLGKQLKDILEQMVVKKR